MGKTAVFVLSVLQQLDPVDGEVGAIVICHTRELAYQICHEFERFSVYLPGEKERREEEEIFFSSRFERSGQRSEEAFSCFPFSFFGFSFFFTFFEPRKTKLTSHPLSLFFSSLRKTNRRPRRQLLRRPAHQAAQGHPPRRGAAAHRRRHAGPRQAAGQGGRPQARVAAPLCDRRVRQGERDKERR